MTSHTPGPWTVRADPFPPADANGQPMKGLDAVFHTIGKDTLMAIAEHVLPANARLIASAPDMLAALQAINAALTQPVQFSGTDAPGTCNILRGDCQVAGSIARAAIAKATGGTE